MTYKQAYQYILADFYRYYDSPVGFKNKCLKIVRILLLERGFKFQLWWRLNAVNGIFKTKAIQRAAITGEKTPITFLTPSKTKLKF